MQSQSGNWITKAIATGSISGPVAYVWSHIVLPWVVPAGTPIVVGLIARIQGFPWTETIVASLVAFAAVSHGLLRFDEWRGRRRIEGKLNFTQAIVGTDIAGRGIVIGLRVDSTASFPLEFEVTQIRTRIGNTVPILSHVAKKYSIPANGYGWYYDHPIIVNSVPRPGTLEGFMEFQVRYGVPNGPLKYGLSGKKQIVAKFNDDGVFAGGAWHEAS